MSINNTIELEETDKETYKARIIFPEGKSIEIDEDNIRIDDFRKKGFCVSVD